jgi:hypothetical protein
VAERLASEVSSLSVLGLDIVLLHGVLVDATCRSACSTEWAVEGSVVAVGCVGTQATARVVTVRSVSRLAGLKPRSCQH